MLKSRSAPNTKTYAKRENTCRKKNSTKLLMVPLIDILIGVDDLFQFGDIVPINHHCVYCVLSVWM